MSDGLILADVSAVRARLDAAWSESQGVAGEVLDWIGRLHCDVAGLRGRLDAVLLLHEYSLVADGFVCVDRCSCGFVGPGRAVGELPVTCPTFRAARGVTDWMYESARRDAARRAGVTGT